MYGAQDSSSFILLHLHSKVFKIIYTNCPGNVKVIVRETSVTRRRGSFPILFSRSCSCSCHELVTSGVQNWGIPRRGMFRFKVLPFVQHCGCPPRCIQISYYFRFMLTRFSIWILRKSTTIVKTPVQLHDKNKMPNLTTKTAKVFYAFTTTFFTRRLTRFVMAVRRRA